MTEILPTTRILERWGPGSGDGDWPTEWADIVPHKGGKLIARLIRSIATKGVKKPLLLGDDGRVWDGHHRLFVARLLGIETLPVEYDHRENPEPGRTQPSQPTASPNPLGRRLDLWVADKDIMRRGRADGA